MNQNSLLEQTLLFSGIEPQEIHTMLNCLSPVKQHYKKGNFIFQSGEKIHAMGMVLSGAVHIIKEDFWGNRTIISEASAGSLFGEVYACTFSSPAEVSAIAAESCEILFLNVGKVMNVCTSACTFHTRLIHNLLSVLAEKNLMLTRKMEHMSKKTTREKLLSYLSAESLKKGTPSFEIPFNRQQLAEYLSVDRSAMSNELSKLRDEGLLTFYKNKFCLLAENTDNQI